MGGLDDKRILVIGGTSGIGLGVAKGVLEAGCQGANAIWLRPNIILTLPKI
jgi:NAD(P)-dependent dehydrogenase (short-subunit alcohol dehydrogenase family)